MCHNGTVLFLLRYCNGDGKTVATAVEIGFVAENTLAKQIPTPQKTTAREGGVAHLWGDHLPPRS